MTIGQCGLNVKFTNNMMNKLIEKSVECHQCTVRCKINSVLLKLITPEIDNLFIFFFLIWGGGGHN